MPTSRLATTSALVVIAGTFAIPVLAQPSQTQQQSQSTQQAPQQMTAGAMNGQAVYRPNGQEFGRANQVVRAGNAQMYLVVMSNNRMLLVPIEQVTFQNGRHTIRANEDQIRNFQEYRQGMAGYQPVPANERVNLAGTQDPAQFVVRQPAASVQVQQAQPNVTVRQAQPEVIVRQPAPTVTIDIPKPDITVRLPQPDVNVALAQPQVDVRQPEPQIQVTQQQQPQVQVQSAQPRVTVQRAEQQPTVRYEGAEPQVRINREQGQPNVRFEQAPGNKQAQAQPKAPAAAPQAAAAPTTPQGAAANTRPIAVSELLNRELYNMRGERLGDVQRVLIGEENKLFVVIGHGGFLGLGEKQILLPMERLRMQDDRLLIQGLTDEQIQAMPEFNLDSATGYREAENDYSADINI